jgi:Ca2+-binding RTX toxin-like protein
LNVASSESLVKVILEEIGHYVDAQINPVDSAGDEGAIFASLVLGETLSTQELQALKAEDDTAYITLNGQQIQIEQQNFTGTNGNDNITGTSGDDTISPLRGQDNVDGGAGNDLLIVDYSGNTSGIYSSLSPTGTGGFNGYFATNDGIDQVNFNNIERFQITGTSADDNIIVGSGDDTVNGGDGIDVLGDDFSASKSNLTFNFAGATPVTPTGTSITNIERFNLTTGSGKDSITLTGIYNDYLTTGAGDDTINPGRGIDYVDGGDGNDILIVDYSGNTTGYIYSSLSPTGTGGFYGYFATNDGVDRVDYTNIERFQITGTSVDDNIIVGSGDDTVNGGDGIDFLGDDFSASTSNLTFNFAGATPVTPTGTSITNIERFNLTTGSGNDSITLTGIYNDTLTTGAGDDTINPGRGIDNVDGGAGNDLLIVDYSGNTSGIYSSLSPTGTGGFNGYFYTNDGIDQVNFNNIERFQITGTSADDSIYTGSGNDTVNGGVGNDSIYAGSGNDIIIGVNPNSSNPGQGESDSLTGEAGSDQFVLGDATWIGYDDGNSTSAGNSDYALITDFNPTEDTIQLRGPSSNYLLVVSGTDTQLYTDKTGEPDELIAIIQNRIGLSLTGSYFSYVSNPTLPSITLAVSPASVNEDGTTNLAYTFTRTGVTTNALTVNYTLGGTATLNTDYTRTGTTNTVTFAAGSATATVTVDPTADTIVESNETVILTLATGTGYTVGTPNAVTGTITNDDVTLPSITLAVSPSSVTEDGTTNLVYTFTRSGVTTNALTVNYTLGGTATLNTDYTRTGTTNTVTFAAGSSTATVTVDPTADTTVESDETVILTLATGTGYTVGTTTAVTGTITNDDVTLPTGV